MELMKGAEKHQEYEDRITKIMLEGIAKRNKIQNDNRFTTQEKAKLVQSSSNEDSDAIAKIELERFKTSDVWVQAFSDIDRLSIDSIKLIADKIRAFKNKHASELGATDLKEITNQLEKLDEKVRDVDFGELFKDIFTKIDIQPLKDKVTEAQAEVDRLLEIKRNAVVEEGAAKQEVDKYDGKPDSPEKRAAMKNLTVAQLNTEEATKNLTNANKDLAASEKAVVDGTNAQAEAIDTLDGQIKNVSDAIGGIKSAFDGLTGAYKETAEAMGIVVSEEELAVIDGISSGLGAVVAILGAVAAGITAVNAAAKLLETSTGVLFIASAVLAGIIAAISIINKLSLAKYNNEIERHEKAIARLEKEYNKLKIAAESLSGNEYIQNTQDQITNAKNRAAEALEKANAEYEKIQEKESHRIFLFKIKANKDDYEKYLKEYEDYLAEVERLSKDLSSEVLGGDIRSTADSFADAWLDAYLSFGNTADAINGKFKEMMRKMVLNTVLTSIMNKVLSPVYTLIDNLGKDGELDGNDIEQIFSLFGVLSKDADAKLTAAAEGLGTLTGDMRDNNNNLNGLSKGIAGASEETVGMLAGYMDSIRFRLFAYIDYMMASGQGNTMSSLMQAQTTQIVHLANIDANTLRSAIANEDLTKEVKKLISVGSKGAYALNVNI